jgi:hypothetical protein
MVSSSGFTSARREGFRRVLSALGVLAVVAGALFGADVFGVRESVFGGATPVARPVAVSPFVSVGAGGARAKSVLRSQPWWQGVSELSGGAGTTTAAFKIESAASQWRAKWTCRAGHLVAQLPAQPRPLIDAACPGAGSAYGTRTGEAKLQIRAAGTWTLRVDQQVDVPLVQPPLPSMTAPGTVVVMRGTFNRIDQTGTGRIAVYRLAGGGYAVRLSNFYVTPNIDLQIRLSPLSEPRSTRQFLSEKSVLVAPLDITAGSMNFTVPPAIDPTRYRSVVIWCPLITSAYAEAPLTSAR